LNRLEGNWSEQSGQGGSGRSNASQGTRVKELAEIDATLEEEPHEGKNFKPEEERQLTQTVLSISQDAITGNGKKGSAFWECIFQHYNARRPFHFRPTCSL